VGEDLDDLDPGDRDPLCDLAGPGKVFDLELPLDQAAAGYQAMDQRDAIKVLLRP
jgi:hypothetical protein